MPELAVVGDVHGEIAALEEALQHLSLTGRRVIFLGDYVNRGKDSRRVIEALIRFQADHPDSVFLAGNHEVELLRVLDGGSMAWFLSNGGLLTIRSYLGPSPEPDALEHFRRTFPPHHEAFLRSLEPYFEAANILVSHVGFDPGNPDSRSCEDMVMKSHPSLFSSRPAGGKTYVVCGHYVQRSGAVIESDFACIDTGCGSIPGAPLSVLMYPEITLMEFRGQDA